MALKNVSKGPITLKWNGISKILKPGEEVHALEFGIPLGHKSLLEHRMGAKHGALIEIVPDKEAIPGMKMASTADLETLAKDLQKKEKEIDDREAAVALREKAADDREAALDEREKTLPNVKVTADKKKTGK